MKAFEDLNITDDYMFGVVMRHEENAKAFLEALLEKPISKIDILNHQQAMDSSYSGHGIRLDVYIKDEAGSCYNIEMQVAEKPALEKRCRYYASGMDRYQLSKGLDYPELKDTYIIFIMMKDYFKEGLAKYETVSYIDKDSQKPYEDGSHKIYLNASYTKDNTNETIKGFLDYCNAVCTGKDFSIENNNLVTQLNNTVKKSLLSEEEEKSYMTYAMRIQDERRAGINEGIAIGIEQGRVQGREEGREEGREQGIAQTLDKAAKVLVERGTAQNMTEAYGMLRG